MISSLRGRLVYKKNAEAILDVNGVGYNMLLSRRASENLSEINNEYTVITYLDVKENSLQLYGFYDEKEKEIFKLLLTVSGIGPKNAHTILLHTSFHDIINLITNNRSVSSIKIPGIGSKKLELISMTLKDKIFKSGFGEDKDTGEGTAETLSHSREKNRAEALNALINLGYIRSEAEKIIREVLKSDQTDLSTEEIIRKSLEFTTR